MFLYELALHLHLPFNVMLDSMPYEELLGWINYLERRPIGWREDLRSYNFMCTQGYDKKPGDLYPSLGKIYEEPKEKEEGSLGPSFKGSLMFNKILSAKGGEVLDL